ncbi:MAG: ATP-binding protein [Clostridia bacterium]|nr:ATP-binding protein [Clostridia bacterium]
MAKKVSDLDYINSTMLTSKTEFDAVLPDVFENGKDYIYLGADKYARVCVISLYPNTMYLGFLNDLFEINDINISVFVDHIKNSDVIRIITSKLATIESNRILQEKRTGIADYGLRQAVSDLESMRQMIQTNNDRMANLQILITLWGSTIEELNEKTNWLQDICARKSMRARVCIYEQDKAFISTLPIENIKYMYNMRNVTTGAIASVIPIGNTEMSHEGGIFLGNNLYTGSPIFFDNFIGPPLLTNPMMAIFGMAGAGKSVTMKTMLARGVAAGEWVIVLDPENEYEGLVRYLGGQYMEIKSGEFSGLNPFELDVEDDGREQIINIYGKLSEIREMVSMFCEKFREEPLHGREITTVEEIVKSLYAKRGITKDPRSLYREAHEEIDGQFYTGRVKKDMPTLSELQDELSQIEWTEELSEIIKILTEGNSLSMFDGQTEIDVGSRLIGINLKNLTDEFMKFFATVNILSWIWSKFSNWQYKNFKKRVVIDEGWLFARYPHAATFLEEIARRGRKYRISLVIASQMINEFLANDSGKAVINQCATKFVMKQDPAVARQVADYLLLSSNCREMMSNFTPGQGILLTDTDTTLMQITPFDFEWDYIRT